MKPFGNGPEKSQGDIMMRVVARTSVAAFALTVTPLITVLLGRSLCLPGVAEAQQRFSIGDEPSCGSCKIRMETVVTLGTVEGPAALERIDGVRVDGRGRYWVFSWNQMPLLFAADGRFLQQVGQRGQGPGEMVSPLDMWVVSGDSILIRGPVLGYLFDPDLKFVRTVRLNLRGGFINDGLVLDWPSDVVVNSTIRTRELIGIPFHLLDFSGTAVRVTGSFGTLRDKLTPSNMHELMTHKLAPSTSGGYWSVPLSSYTLTKWNSRHEPTVVLERRPAWFPGRSDLSAGGPTKPPSPMFRSLFEDADGLVWTFSFVPSPDYKKTWTKVAHLMIPGSRGEYPANLIDDRYLYYTRVEIVDLVSKTVVASHIFNAPVLGVLPDRRIVFHVESPEGAPLARIVRLTLLRE